MSSIIKNINKAFNKWELVLVYIGAVCTLIIMAMTTIDVIGRNLFSFTIRGCSELVALMLLPSFVGAIPYVQSTKGHVFLEVATVKAPKAVKYILDIFGVVVGAFIFISITPTTFNTLLTSITKQETSAGTAHYPIWPFKLVLFLMVLTLAIRLIINIVGDIVCAKENLSKEDEKTPEAVAIDKKGGETE